MVLVDDQQLIKELAAQRPDDPLADGIRSGGLRRAGEDLILAPPAPGDQLRQRREPQPVGRTVQRVRRTPGLAGITAVKIPRANAYADRFVLAIPPPDLQPQLGALYCRRAAADG